MNIPFWPMLWLTGTLSGKMKVVRQQSVALKALPSDWHYRELQDHGGPILDLGGGGEGAIGLLMGKQVTAVDIRQDELDEAPEGPIKVVADAKALPFEPESFDCATAFYFLMYLPPADLLPVLKEAYRVLKPGGKLLIWETAIPVNLKKKDQLFVVPVKIQLPGQTQYTAYGAKWGDRTLSYDLLQTLGEQAGFVLLSKSESSNGQIEMTLVKRPL